MTALLSLRGVSKRFRGLVAVDTVSFDVPAGELFAVIGPNGAGKTTLFNIIAGAIAPDEGSITFAGEPIGGLPPDVVCRRGILAPPKPCGSWPAPGLANQRDDHHRGSIT